MPSRKIPGKYITWSASHSNPFVRVPHPDGSEEVIHVQRRESDAETLNECIRLRDLVGVRIWGRQQWERMLAVKRRSLARHRKETNGPITGVFHYERPDGGVAWVASWYERESNEGVKKKAKHYSYGKPRSQFETSEQAMLAAIEKRNHEERKWYSVVGPPGSRKANNLDQG